MHSPYDAERKQRTALARLQEAGFSGAELGEDCLVVEVEPSELLRLLEFARDDAELLCKILITVTAVDHPGEPKRFHVAYHLLSVKKNLRLRVRTRVASDQTIPSASGIYSAAGWFERETWDMFGVRFSDHGDLRRILSDYGFQGHPLRKDFPLSGYVEVRYDPSLKRVMYEPVKLDQEYRFFDTASPWQGVAEIAGKSKPVES